MNPAGRLLLDASCLLNLYATGRMRDIAVSIGYQFEVVDYVLEYETLYVRQPSPSGTEEERVPVVLDLLVDEGLLRVVELKGQDALASFVQLASLVDDGEAATGALALHRNCSIAIDDRKARRVFGELMAEVALVSTLEIMELWAETTSVPTSELQDAFRAMHSRASYLPGRRDPLYRWWVSVMSQSDSIGKTQ